ncbi:MAG: hypothetical protein LBL62_11525 [Planctomycetaceae bacterium]|nr:hypothetical protein [Planctomycetaceae bacterium]
MLNRFALPLQGDGLCVRYPPRCGGLIRIAPKGAEEYLLSYWTSKFRC